jgi:hypothetical protein
MRFPNDKIALGMFREKVLVSLTALKTVNNDITTKIKS